MQYLSHFTHALLMFITPLNFLGHKSESKQKFVFTLLYGLGVHFSRSIYNFLNVPFGTHTILLIILNIILFKIIVHNISWKKCIYISLTLFIILLINDSLILLPTMKYFNLTVNLIESNAILRLVIIIVSNFILILASIAIYFKNKYSKKISFL